jgi:hypothetical protein
MRVTDGSSADDPVLGVNVVFATTLAEIGTGPQNGSLNPGEGGMPILLGSSQAQVVTDQNGLASISPSALNVGPCDVFITVNAGAASAQFQMESLAVIVLPQPAENHVPVPTTFRSASFIAPTFTFAPTIAPEQLFEMPLVISNNDPAEDVHLNDSTETIGGEIPGDQGTSPTSSPANEKSASPPTATSKPVADQAPKKALPATSVVAPYAGHDADPDVPSGVIPAVIPKDAPIAAAAQSPSVSAHSPP